MEHETTTLSGHSEKRRLPLLLALLAIVLCGAYFRLAHLGETSIRGDCLSYWQMMKSGASISELYFSKTLGAARHSQMPFPAAYARAFLNVFRLPLNLFTLRLPFALCGLLCVPLCYAAGRRIAGAPLGLLCAAMMAFNPFHIQCSREPYPYVLTTTGGALGLLALLMLVERLHKPVRLGFGFYITATAGFFLLINCNVTSYPLAVLLGGALGVGGVLLIFRKPCDTKPILIGGACLALVGLPQIIKVARNLLRPDLGASQRSIFTQGVTLFDPGGLPFFSRTMWGGATWALFLLVLVAGAVAWRIGKRREPALFLMAGLVLGSYLLSMVARYKTGTPFTPRYMVSMQPIYLVLLCCGAMFGVERLAGLARQVRLGRILSGLLPTLLVLPLLYPAELATRLTGTPAPYGEISRWCDANLKHGIPVLSDYWLAPGNQFQVHPATNVVYTFTFPNEPEEVFKQKDWRGSAVDFLTRFPDAAYLELNKRYWDRPGVGPFEWPRTHFRQRKVFRNEAGLKLREWGLAYRKAFYAANTNMTVVELFYNLPEDNANMAREAGARLLALYGDDWSYAKTRDLRDWRVLNESAAVDLYKFAEGDSVVNLRILGAAAGPDKRVVSENGLDAVFKSGVPAWVELGPLTLSQEKTTLVLTDPTWHSHPTPLVVADIELLER